jgi:hypothetical protein
LFPVTEPPSTSPLVLVDGGTGELLPLLIGAGGSGLEGTTEGVLCAPAGRENCQIAPQPRKAIPAIIIALGSITPQTSVGKK